MIKTIIYEDEYRIFRVVYCCNSDLKKIPVTKNTTNNMTFSYLYQF